MNNVYNIIIKETQVLIKPLTEYSILEMGRLKLYDIS